MAGTDLFEPVCANKENLPGENEQGKNEFKFRVSHNGYRVALKDKEFCKAVVRQAGRR
jgi:hypothetical protein